MEYGITFYPLSAASEADLAWFHDLYDSAFPDFEQRTRPGRDRILRECPAYQAQIFHDGGERAGILGGWQLGEWYYIEHFAVDASRRGQGTGRRAMAAIASRFAQLILEIDPPVDEIARRRLAFYQGCGFVANPFAHRHPSYKTQYAPHELVVLSYPQALAGEEYLAFNEGLCREVMAEGRL